MDLAKVEEEFTKVSLQEMLDHTINRIVKAHSDNFRKFEDGKYKNL